MDFSPFFFITPHSNIFCRHVFWGHTHNACTAPVQEDNTWQGKLIQDLQYRLIGMKQTTLIWRWQFICWTFSLASHSSEWYFGKFFTCRKRIVMWGVGSGLLYGKDFIFIPSVTFILKHFSEKTKIQANLLHAHAPFPQPIWGLFRQLQGTDKRSCKKKKKCGGGGEGSKGQNKA